MISKHHKSLSFLGLLLSLSLLQACQNHVETQNTSETRQSDQAQTSEITSPNTTQQARVGNSVNEVNQFQSKLDLKALESGDYSSLVGTWQNDLGDSYRFEADGLVSTDLKINGAFARKDGFLEMMLVKGQEEHIGLLLAPAGKAYSSDFFADASEDNSDFSRDRFVLVNQQFENNHGFDSRVFYKVKD